MNKQEWNELKKKIKTLKAYMLDKQLQAQNLPCGSDDYLLDCASDSVNNAMQELRKQYPILDRLSKRDPLMNRYFWSNTWNHTRDNKLYHAYHPMNHCVYIGKSKAHKKPKKGFNDFSCTLNNMIEGD